MLTKEAARAILKLIQADAKKDVKAAGGSSWTKVADSDGGVVLVIKVDCIDKNQTILDEFKEE